MPIPRAISVLVVDDEPDVVESTVELLRLEGFQVTGVGGGQDAIDAAMVDPPDVALVDLVMPEVDGFEVARRLRSGGGGRCPVLIAVTGQTADWDRVRAHQAGFVLYLSKPVPPEELVTVVRQCADARAIGDRRA